MRELKVLNISSNDQIGGRFNGFDIKPALLEVGVDTSLGCFWNHQSEKEWAFNLFPGNKRRMIAEGIRIIETLTGFQNTLQWWSHQLLESPQFLNADVIHLHIIHDHFLKFEIIQEIVSRKPTVWTWHDLWPVTGHCILPVGCHRWSKGCGSCPDLAAPLPVFRDRTEHEYRRKLNILSKCDLNIHVSTSWMEQHVRDHMTASACEIHKFPFGIDLDVFRPMNGVFFRQQLGIENDSFVVFARATDDPRKSFLDVVRSLDRLSLNNNIVLLTVQDQSFAERNSKNLRIIQFPWVHHPSDLSKLYAICDIFVMPSTVESFGVMALEAMACGKPVIHVEDTATAEVVYDSRFAIAPHEREEGLKLLLQNLILNRELVRVGGERARHRAESEFSLNDYVSNLVRLYKHVMKTRQ